MKRRNAFYPKISVVLAISLVILLILVVANSGFLGTPFSGIKHDVAQKNPQSQPEPVLPVISRNTEPSTELRFAVISDLHVRSTDKIAQSKVQNALSDLLDPQQSPLDLIVVNGDLGDGLPADYRSLNQLIQNVRSGTTQTTPILFTIGNHEFYKAYHEPNSDAWNKDTFPNGDTDEQAVQRFLNFSGRDKVYADSMIKGYHFIFLGSEKSAMSDPNIGDGVYLSEEQLAWLEQKLAENADPKKPIFVFLHQPVFTANSDSPIKSQYVMQHEKLVNILESYPQVILFSGHLHLKIGAPGTVVHETFTLFGDSSVTRVRQATPEASEGLIVKAGGSKVTVQGRDFEQHKFIPQSDIALDYGK
ncbi:metallophosphoesterase family protein [Desulfitobacterium sp.]|uniref:metallophosphoesterase family protein n=1 Tax=Desulfitobacterium sp. TaxID=49981 RepID=UPI002B6D7155|nr:metallophosphoesterase [Desulfitobacterium sp.]HVJ47589.1 metallophosphoesterase [Desulfitobacterium sp.]